MISKIFKDQMMQERAAKIKLLIVDVDGVMTDGLLYYNDVGEALKSFNARDGLGLRLLMEHGVDVAIITGRNSKIVEARAKELGIAHVYQGRINKLQALEELMQKLKLNLTQVSYMGDDVIDLPILSRVGLSAAPKNAHATVLGQVHFISSHKGGRGAVRELTDLILMAQNKWNRLLKDVLERGELFTQKDKSSC